MKITGPGSASPPDGPNDTSGAKEAGRSGKAFADKLSAPESTQKVAGAEASTIITADITSELKAGRLKPEVAIERVVDRVLERQLGADAPAAVRDQVRAALRDAIEADPILAEKFRSLTG